MQKIEFKTFYSQITPYSTKEGSISTDNQFDPKDTQFDYHIKHFYPILWSVEYHTLKDSSKVPKGFQNN